MEVGVEFMPGTHNSNLMSVIISGGWSQPTHHAGNSKRTVDIMAWDGW
jgi:hypothetical protein